ncbi:hypothetical protein, partial [Jeotgalibaca porci]|uniref:hypothetical protein n=1 Tax=Jeotgalibaca porci TaxID=1868793 RepID=UPI00359F4788
LVRTQYISYSLNAMSISLCANVRFGQSRLIQKYFCLRALDSQIIKITQNWERTFIELFLKRT